MKKRIACLLLTFVMLLSLIPTAAITASAAGLTVSEAGIKVIKNYMGFKGNAYKVAENDYRIGYGTPSVAGATITEANADKYLREQLASIDAVVNATITKALVQKQHDALVWLTYVEGAGWTADAAAVNAIMSGASGSALANALCTFGYAANFPDDAASRSIVTTRMAIANLYLRGVYSSANTGSLSYTIFNPGENLPKMIQVFDCNQITQIAVSNPYVAGKQFLGWYDGSALVTGVGSATAGKTLTARYQAGEDKVAAMYTLPASVIYEAAGIPDNQELIVYSDTTGTQKIDVVIRERVVTIVAEKIYGGYKWLELSTGGWVKFAAIGATLPTIVPSKVVTITDDYVNIRKDPDVTSLKVGVAKRGETRTIVMTVGDLWGYCSEGWIYLAYTDYNKTTSGAPIPGTGTPGTVVGAEQVNVRSGAGVGNALVTRLAQGTAVNVYEQVNVGTAPWGRIDQGWISMQYVQLKQSATTGSAVPTGSTAIVSSTARLNIRSGPGTEYTKIGTLAPGASVVILQKQTVGGVSWALIDQGWINMNYVTAGITGSGSAGAGIGGTVVNCANGVNIRSAAGTTNALRVLGKKAPNALVGVAALGSRVSVSERVQVNGHYWGRIDRGWVCMDYIKLDREFVDQNNSSAGVVDNIVTSFVGYPAVILADNTPVRETASSDAKIVVNLKANAELNITDRVVVGTNTFGKVNVGGIVGWVNLAQVKLSQVNAKVTAAKADAYELPSVRSKFYASLVKGAHITVGNADGTGWQLADGALWGQTTVTVGGVDHIAWIKLSDVTMFKENTMPTGITTLSGVGYLTGTITADTVVYRDSNGNVTTEASGYNLVSGHRVNILARNYVPATKTTWAKVTVGSITGWINIDNVALDPVVQQATMEIKLFNNLADIYSNSYMTMPVGTKVTILTRSVQEFTNELNHGISDYGYVYLNDNAVAKYWLLLDDGKLASVSAAPSVDNTNPSVVAGVVVTGTAISNVPVYEDAIAGSRVLLNVSGGTNVTVLNWKIVDGKVWGKVQIGKIVGWVDVNQLSFAGLSGTVAVAELPVYANPDKGSSVQILRMNNKVVPIPELIFDGSVLWGRIAVADKIGWIDLANVLLNTPGAVSRPELVIATGKINSVDAFAVLVDSNEVISIPKDTAVNLAEVRVNAGAAQWKVDLADKDGWVDMKFININPVTARVTEASALIYNDLVTAGTAGAQTLYTLYRDETITVQSFAMMGGSLYGQVPYGSTTGWILICDSANLMKVSLAPGASGSIIGGAPTTPSTPAQPTTPPAAQGTAAYISCNTVVNVRAAADPTSALVTTLPNGTVINITEQTTYIGKGWARIEQGWVCMDYVKLGTPGANTNTNTNGGGNVSIMTTVPGGAIAVGYANEDVRIRTGSGLGYPEVAVVKKGNSLVIYEKRLDGGMSWGRTDNGWVCLSYLTITGIGGAPNATIANCGFTANVRGSASAGGSLMAKVMVSSRVAVYETVAAGAETWARTDLGWINGMYVAMDSAPAPVPTQPATPNPTPVVPEAAPIIPSDGSVG